MNAKLPSRKPLDEMPHAQKAIKAAEKKLGTRGRVVVRWSGTEPKLRVMLEGEDEKQIRAMADGIVVEAERDLA